MQTNTCDVFPTYFYINHLNKLHNYHDELLYTYRIKVYTNNVRDDITISIISLQIYITIDMFYMVECDKKRMVIYTHHKLETTPTHKP